MSTKQDTDVHGSSVARRLTDAMADDIFQGRLVPGQRLVEAEIQSRFGAGRSSVREALHELRAQGLVTLEANRGATVRRLSRSEVEDLFAIRERLEALAAATAARRVRDGTASRTVLLRLEKISKAMAQAIERGDALAYGQLNRDWHRAVLALADNAELTRLVRQLSLPIFQHQFRGFLKVASQRVSHAQHLSILAAVAKGDAAAADRLMARHVKSGLKMVLGWDDSRFALESNDE